MANGAGEGSLGKADRGWHYVSLGISSLFGVVLSSCLHQEYFDVDKYQPQVSLQSQRMGAMAMELVHTSHCQLSRWINGMGCWQRNPIRLFQYWVCSLGGLNCGCTLPKPKVGEWLVSENGGNMIHQVFFWSTWLEKVFKNTFSELVKNIQTYQHCVHYGKWVMEPIVARALLHRHLYRKFLSVCQGKCGWGRT